MEDHNRPTCKVVRGAKGAQLYPRGCKVRKKVGADGRIKHFNKNGLLKRYLLAHDGDGAYNMRLKAMKLNVKVNGSISEAYAHVDTGAPGYLVLGVEHAVQLGLLEKVVPGKEVGGSRARTKHVGYHPLQRPKGADYAITRKVFTANRRHGVRLDEMSEHKNYYMLSNVNMTVLDPDDNTKELDTVIGNVTIFGNSFMALFGLHLINSLRIARIKFDARASDMIHGDRDELRQAGGLRCQAVLRDGQKGARIFPKGCKTDYKLVTDDAGNTTLRHGRDGDKHGKISEIDPYGRWYMLIWSNPPEGRANTRAGQQPVQIKAIHDSGAGDTHISLGACIELGILARGSTNSKPKLGPNAGPDTKIDWKTYMGQWNAINPVKIPRLLNVPLKLSDMEQRVFETVVATVSVSDHGVEQAENTFAVVGLHALMKMRDLRYAPRHGVEPYHRVPEGWETM